MPEVTASLPGIRTAGAAEIREWTLNHYLALIGIVFVGYQSVAWIGWLADGPVQVVLGRDTTSITWYVCKFYEMVAIVTTLSVGIILYRQCRAERGLSFDAMFCIACFSLYWQDALANFFQPLFLWSSNWYNLNDWTAHLPFIQFPDAGRLPEPVVFDGLNYLSAWLCFAMMLNGLMDWWKRRFPNAKARHLVLIAFLVGGLIDVLLELPMYYFQTWAFPGTPDIGIWADSAKKFPLVEMISGAIMFSIVASVRYFRDANGLRLVERGLSGHPRGIRKLLITFSMIGLFNVAYLADNSMYWFVGLHSAPYKEMPLHLHQLACDAPGTEGTQYGACPGSPGYRLPLPSSMPDGFIHHRDTSRLNSLVQCSGCELKMVDHVPVVDGPRPDLAAASARAER